ncbi:DNA-binding response regulator, NarL/FixJ family, contains REC and HTH domains [Mucilaginibacter gossypiicola]|uniref:DNA-binding response regulator, NarL/FixJ family, contains REC and HTH domains n=1 Tax=Mucilaginibacter gossypiicola TaxID=551995 RepID=A0A1H8K9C6_9SPHI|nr:response regulator transcription factor [Mucilaginibacter gossypiicola]SEN89327.1 DNA-binding response regulator, NarL/FixJ family, contains REC and HTH domains [Mucilaginibacter gossypiicola]
MENKEIRIAVVDDHTLFRQGISSLLSENEEIKIMFDASNGAVMKEKISKYPLPDVVLMDITMPLVNGYEATAWLKQNYPSVRVLALSMFEDDEPIIKMLKCGAGGYVLKESNASDLMYAIKTIAQHNYFLNDLVSGKLLRSIQDEVKTPDPVAGLTANEIRFLELCCSELTYKEIAGNMCLSPHTIDNYRDALFQKFDLKSRTGLVIFALKHNIAKF